MIRQIPIGAIVTLAILVWIAVEVIWSFIDE